MNKVKFMLSAVAVIAIVGGALAFKASKQGNANVFCNTFGSPRPCQKVLFTTDNSTSPSDNPCSGGVYFTQSDCQSPAITTNDEDPGTLTIQPVKAVTE